MRYLVTRPEPEAGVTAEAIVALGHEAVVDPMLRIVLGARGTLDLFGVQALAVTSPNGARALAEAGAAVKSLPMFAVGDATAALARACGFQTVISAHGDGAALAEVILDRVDPTGGPILWAHGHDKALDLADHLRRSGLRARAVEVYRAEPAPALAAETVAALSEGSLDGILVFSPRTGRIVIERLTDEGLIERARDLVIHALSEKVAAPFEAAGFRHVRVAAEPNAGALYQTLPKATKSRARVVKPSRKVRRDAAVAP